MKSKNLLIVAAWLLGAVLFIFMSLQLQGYARTLNESGVIRGATQRVVKLEIADRDASASIQRVDDLIDRISEEEADRLFKSDMTLEFIEKVDATKAQWTTIKDEIAALDKGTGSMEHLIDLSERHFELADDMVESAQHRAEKEFLASVLAAAVLILTATTIIMVLDRNSTRQRKAAYRTDPLTKGRNRIAFDEDAQAVLSNAKSNSYVLAYSNVSNFRFINDSFGYATGDKLIVSLGTFFEEHCQGRELSAHVNADHFVLLLENRAGRIDELVVELDKHLCEQKSLWFSDILSCGFGVCLVDETVSPETAIGNAIAAIKEGTLQDGVAWYDEAFRDTLAQNSNVVKHMAEGIRNDEFKIYVQPQIDLRTGEINGMEALCRWDSAALGFLAPDSFIPQFEKNGFIVEFDYHICDKACAQFADLRATGEAPPAISVNFSRSTITQRDFSERLEQTLRNRGIPNHAFEIEVTETVFSVDEDMVIGILESLRAKGFRVAMDDFGKGYSSLSLLSKLPIDVLKIDRQFISQETSSSRGYRILRSIVDLANELCISTVCEGIETAGQAAALTRIGCATGQGYYYAKPIPIESFLSFAHDWESRHENC